MSLMSFRVVVSANPAIGTQTMPEQVAWITDQMTAITAAMALGEEEGDIFLSEVQVGRWFIKLA